MQMILFDDNRKIKNRHIFLIGLLIFCLYCYKSDNGGAVLADDVPELVFSHESGFYDKPFILTIESKNGTIFYTLDGSVPTAENGYVYDDGITIQNASQNDNLYCVRNDLSTGFYHELIDQYSFSSPGYVTPDYLVDKCTVIRAVLAYNDGTYSDIKTASYFVGLNDEDSLDNMSVVSIVTEPDGLFGYEDGIYVTGKRFDDYCRLKISDPNEWTARYWWHWDANYRITGRESEREADIQFFDKEKKLLLSQKCGIRIHGQGSRGRYPKSFNLYAREEYDGNEDFLYPFFAKDYFVDKMTLTQGGDDELAKIKDSLMAELSDGLDYGVMDYKPCVMFLDGEYWGVYWLTEKYDDDYIHQHYNVDSNNVVIIKNDLLEEGDEDDFALYTEYVDFCLNSDMTLDENYYKFCEYVDVDSFCDYYASMIYLGRNSDWPNSNIALWRTRKKGDDSYSDGRWRYLAFDVNSNGMDSELAEVDTIAQAIQSSPMFANLMQNKELRNRLLDKLVWLSEHNYQYDVIDKKISFFKSITDKPMMENIHRFYGEGKYYLYENEVEDTQCFFKKRGQFISNLVNNYR